MLRYFNKLIPNKQDILTGKIVGISKDSGVYGECLEYPDFKLFIPPTEINRRKVNLQKFFIPDKLYPLLVLDIDVNKKLIDVSYSKINEKDRETHIERFMFYQKIYNLGLEIIKKFKEQLTPEAIFEKTVWRIFEDVTAENMAEFYLSLLKNPDLLFINSDADSEKWIEFTKNFTEDMKKRVKVADAVLVSEIFLVCLENNAIQKLKDTLLLPPEQFSSNVQIRYISSPRYEIVVTSNTKTDCEAIMKKVLLIIKENCTNNCVRFVKSTASVLQRDVNYSFT